MLLLLDIICFKSDVFFFPTYKSAPPFREVKPFYEEGEPQKAYYKSETRPTN